MNEIAQSLLLKLLQQAERGGSNTLPLNKRSAAAYFQDGSLAAREDIHATLKNAEQSGAVGLEWGRDAAAQDLKRLRLNNADKLAECLGVERAADQAGDIAKELQPLLVDAPDWLKQAAEQSLAKLRQGKHALRLANHQHEEALALFRIALAVSQNQQQGVDLRSFSIRLLGDSKGIERRAARVASLLRSNPEWSQYPDKAELFRVLGLEKFPPVLHIKGPLRLDYGGEPMAINPRWPAVGLLPDMISRLRTSQAVSYLLTIENLASYQRHVREIDDDAVVVYTAGQPSPALMAVLSELDSALDGACPVYHWGDRDIGGLRIFARLSEAFTQHRLQPHLMDQANPRATAFSDSERQWLQRYQQQGAAAGLAQHWLDADLGSLEQEALDPRSPLH